MTESSTLHAKNARMSRADDSMSLWQQDESLRALGARLLASSARPRVVSFDFFETLFYRLCAEPADLFVEIGRQLHSRGLLRTEMSPAAFRAARRMAESKAREAAARSGRSPEIKLDDIYAELAAVVTDTEAARDLELGVERSVGFLNAAMVSLVEHVRNLGCQTAIVCDTYFTAAELLRLLADHGVASSLFNRVLVSCERGRAKAPSGLLYDDLLRQFDVHPGEVLHIGDDLHADVYMSRRLGIDTLHYHRATPWLESVFLGERKQMAPCDAPAGSLETIRVMTARKAQGPGDAFRDGALIFGPVLSRFADWCVDKYARAGVTRVLALMREGELLGDLLHRSAEAAGMKLEVIACYASRMSTACAAMREVNADSAADLLEGEEQMTPQEILEILGLGNEASQFLDEETRTTRLPSPQAARDLLRILFRMPLIRDQIARRHQESRDLAFEYLSSLVGDAPRVGVLDLGFSGSVQHHLASILRRGGKDVRTIGCYLACTPRAARLAIDGHEAHAYLTSDWGRVTVLPSVCLTADVGSIRGYARDASGRVEPVLEPSVPSSDATAVKRRLRDGILSFQERWLAISRRPGQLALPLDVLADIDRMSSAILFRFLDFPTKPEADRLGALCYDENYFGPTKIATLCDEDSRARFRREGARAVFDDPRCYWPQGIMAQVYPRVVSVVRSGWHDARDLGRLGALSLPGGEVPGLSDGELASLQHWVTALSPRQIVLCGAVSPSTAALIEGFAQSEAGSQNDGAARLIVATGCAQCPKGVASTMCAHGAGEVLRGSGAAAWVRGHFCTPETLRTVRSELTVDTDAALVVTSDLDEAEVEALLNGLTPFLGGKGVVLVASGRYDSEEIETRSGVGRPLHAWLSSAAVKTGFVAFLGRPRDRAAARDWLVFWRSPEAMDWSRQWMPIVADLGYDTDIAADDAPAPEHAAESPVPGLPAGHLEAGAPCAASLPSAAKPAPTNPPGAPLASPELP